MRNEIKNEERMNEKEVERKLFGESWLDEASKFLDGVSFTFNKTTSLYGDIYIHQFVG